MVNLAGGCILNTQYKYIYFYFQENSVGQAYRGEKIDGTIEYEYANLGDSVCFDMSKEPNKNAVWRPSGYGEQTELVSEEGFEYEVFSDPRDAFELGYGN